MTQSLSDLLVRVEASAGGADQWGILRDVRTALVPFDGSGDAEDSRAWIFRFNALCDAGGYESASLALVERCLQGWAWSIDHIAEWAGGPEFMATLSNGVNVCGLWARASTAPLALLAALLKALIAQGGERLGEPQGAQRSEAPGGPNPPLTDRQHFDGKEE